LKEERGFSLPEMMVTIVIMIVVFFALYSVFDMSVRIFMFGSNKVEAVESARLGLERMEREIRAAYPVASDSHLFFRANGLDTSNPPQEMPTQNGSQITFGNELGAEGEGDGTIQCGDQPDDPPCEYITYKLTDDVGGSSAPCTVSPCDLRRVNTINSADPGDPVVDNAVFPGGLEFTYLQSDSITPATTESNIAKVRVSLEIMVDPGTRTAARQRLTTEIDLRNR
jgi:prepilin-type N-terminal cleavage/methylation domain-containing protein